MPLYGTGFASCFYCCGNKSILPFGVDKIFAVVYNRYNLISQGCRTAEIIPFDLCISMDSEDITLCSIPRCVRGFSFGLLRNIMKGSNYYESKCGYSGFAVSAG